MNFRSFLTLFVLIISASTACAQDAKKTADDFAAMAGKQTGGRFGWVVVRDGDVWRIVMLTANVSPPK